MTSILRATAAGQNHDRFWIDAAEVATEMASATIEEAIRDANDDNDDITAPQKMMSAISGSLLTSLLGESFLFLYPPGLGFPSMVF